MNIPAEVLQDFQSLVSTKFKLSLLRSPKKDDPSSDSAVEPLSIKFAPTTRSPCKIERKLQHASGMHAIYIVVSVVQLA